MYDKSLVTIERLKELKIKRDAMRCKGFDMAKDVIGEKGAEALKYLYDMFDERIYLWLADLWEPEIGAFYFSNSGRDTDGFLPDIESTVQALRYIDGSGLNAYKYEKMDEKIKQPVVRFARSLQDPDGYFYHPQWGKDIVVSRRGRDLGWATGIIKDYGGTTIYPTPLDKNDDGEKSALLPDHLQSVDNFKKYLSELDIRHRSYWVGNLIQAQINQIISAGTEFVDTLEAWYVENQNLENGTWNDVIDYHATNGLMKVCLAYSAISRPIPNAALAMDAAIAVILSDIADSQITSFYNPWITMGLIIRNLTKFGNPELAAEQRRKVLDNAPMMIVRTADKIKPFAREDGSYSYGPKGSCPTSQAAPVSHALIPEGDVNGNGLATTGVTRNICSVLGITEIKFFTEDDGKLFYELIDKSYPSKKIYPRPEDVKLL